MNAIKLLTLSLALALSACAAKDTAEPPTALSDFSSEASIKQLWAVNTGASSRYSGIELRPYFEGDDVYTSAYDGSISRIARLSGKSLWSKSTPDKISAGLSGSGDTLFYGTHNGDLVAINKANADELWRVPLQSEILVSPVVGSGLVIARTLDGNIQAFAINNGDKRWAYKMSVPALSLHGYSQPIVIEGNALLVGSDNGRLIALNMNNGRVLFETPLALPNGSNPIAQLSDIDMTPSYDGRLLYISAYQNGFSAVDLQKGQVVWRHDASTFQSVSYDDNNIYISDSHSQIWALNRQSGQVVWVQKGLRARKLSGPVLFEGQIVVADYAGYLHILSTADGRFIARQATGSAYLTGPLLSPGQSNIFYYTSKNGQLAAYQVRSNKTAVK